jgi:prevent-host-death family protein
MKYSQNRQHEAKTHLSRLIERAQAGEEVIIAKAGESVVRLQAAEAGQATGSGSNPPGFGSMRGMIELAADCTPP